MDRASYGEQPDDGSAHRPLINAPPNRPSPERLEHELADGAAKCSSYSCHATFCLSLVRRDEPGPSCLEPRPLSSSLSSLPPCDWRDREASDPRAWPRPHLSRSAHHDPPGVAVTRCGAVHILTVCFSIHSGPGLVVCCEPGASLSADQNSPSVRARARACVLCV